MPSPVQWRFQHMLFHRDLDMNFDLLTPKFNTVSLSLYHFFGWVTWVMGQCMLTHDPPLFYQPSESQ